MNSSERLHTTLARFQISEPRKAAPKAAATDPAAVNGVDVLRRLLKESGRVVTG